MSLGGNDKKAGEGKRVKIASNLKYIFSHILFQICQGVVEPLGVSGKETTVLLSSDLKCASYTYCQFVTSIYQ